MVVEIFKYAKSILCELNEREKKLWELLQERDVRRISEVMNSMRGLMDFLVVVQGGLERAVKRNLFPSGYKGFHFFKRFELTLIFYFSFDIKDFTFSKGLRVM